MSPAARAGASGGALPWEWARLAVLGATLAWTVACLGGYRPETLLVTGPGVASLLVLHLLSPAPRSRTHPIVLLTLPFLGYAALNAAFITPVAWVGWQDVFNWALMAAVFWVVATGIASDGPRRWALGTVIAVAAASCLAGCFQHWVRPNWLMLHRAQAEQFIGRSSGTFGIPNSLAALCLLVLPVSLWLVLRREATPRSRLLGIPVCLLISIGLALTVSRGAWLALAVALAAWPLVLGSGSLPRRLGLAAAVIAGLSLAAAALIVASPLVHQRVAFLIRDMGERSRPILWRAAVHIVQGHPWVGGGAGAFDTLFERWRPEGFNDDPRWAHNDYLNTACDYGLIGTSLALIPVGFALARLKRSRGLEASLAVGLTAFALQLVVDFNLKIPGLAMSMAIVAALALGSDRRQPDPEASAATSVALRVVAAAGVVIVTACLWLPRQRAEAIRYHAREGIDRWGRTRESASAHGSDVAQWVRHLEQATTLDPGNAKAWSDLAYARSLQALVSPADTVALGKKSEQDALKAIGISNLISESWDRLGMALDMQHRWTDGGDAIVKALALAPANAQSWYYYGYHLSLSPTSREEALAAVDTCLRLDPGYLPAQSLRQQLAITR